MSQIRRKSWIFKSFPILIFGFCNCGTSASLVEHPEKHSKFPLENMMRQPMQLRSIMATSSTKRPDTLEVKEEAREGNSMMTTTNNRRRNHNRNEHSFNGVWKTFVDANSPLDVHNPAEAVLERKYSLEKIERQLLEQQLWNEKVNSRRMIVRGRLFHSKSK